MRGASERLMPILMTATVTALGLLPLALGTGEAGREIEGPMAIVILGGLVTSTALNLFVLPTLALRYGRFVPRKPWRIEVEGKSRKVEESEVAALLTFHLLPFTSHSTCMMAKMTRKPATVERREISGGFFSWASGNRSLAPR